LPETTGRQRRHWEFAEQIHQIEKARLERLKEAPKGEVFDIARRGATRP
jgi:hypothetical protein